MRRLAVDPSYDPAVESAVAIAEVTDAVYRRGWAGAASAQAHLPRAVSAAASVLESA